MDFRYVQSCPTCGAPIETAEADRVIECMYCDVKNYMVQKRPLRFVLPHLVPQEIHADDIIHIPYLRFKGNIFTAQGAALDYKIVDTTHLGFSSNKLPTSLGLRPQAMKVQLVGAGHPGKFLKLTEKVKDIFTKAARLTDAFSDSSGEVYHRSFVGETISFIYLPVYYANSTLMDGILNRPVTKALSKSFVDKFTVPAERDWQPTFISTLCPNCAETMQGEKDSLALVCFNCTRVWIEEKGRFVEAEWAVISGGKKSTCLPFWRLGVKFNGIDLSSFGDFLRVTNQPIVIREKHDSMRLYLLLPAFKIRPKDYLSLAKNITLSQGELTEGRNEFTDNLHPVTLPATEAAQSISAVISHAVMNKRKFLPKLPEINYSITDQKLVYLPFHRMGNDLVQDQSFVSVAKSVLRFGKFL